MLLHLFGGTFDPPHRGHLDVVKFFSRQSDLVLVCPVHRSEGKAPVAAAELRLHMCELAFQGLNNVQVTAIDIERGGFTYTIDTVRDIQAAYPGAEIHVVIGADALRNLPTWHQVEILKALVSFDVVSRNQSVNVPPDFNIHLHEIDTTAISSTLIRDGMKTQAEDSFDLKRYTTEPVSEFILRNGLYQA